MEFAKLVKTRRSIRTFAARDIEPAKLKSLLELVNLAPSAGNLQAYEIYEVTSAKVRAALAHAAGQSYIAEAPLILAFCANPGRSARKYGARGKELYAVQDATIAATYAMLGIADLGLATVWIGAFDDDAVSSALSAPQDWIPVALLPIGYADEDPAPSSRRKVEDLVHPI